LTLACALFSWAVGSLLGQYISLFYGDWNFPVWLYGLLFLLSFESVFYSAYVLSPRTPLTWRFLEIGLMWFLVTICLRMGRSFSYPWWAVWRAAVDKAFLFPFGLAFLTWSIAGGFGQQLSRMKRIADELGDQAASTISWEFESLALKPENSSIPLEYFLRRWVGFAVLFAGLAIAVRRSGIQIASPFLMAGLYTLLLGTGLVAQGSAYLERLATIWEQIGLEYPRVLTANWIRSLLIVSLVLMVLINVIPVDFSPLTYDDLVRFFFSLLHRFSADSPALPEVPEEDLSPPGGGGVLQLPWQADEEEPPMWAGIIALLYIVVFVGGLGMAVAVFVGFVIVTFAQSELERLRGLPKAAVQFYLAVRTAFQQAYSFVFSGFRSVKRYAATKAWSLSRSQGEPEGVYTSPSRRDDPLAQDIRGAYRQLVQQATSIGLVQKSSETPGEFGRQLQQTVPEHEPEIADFIDAYHLARYSNHALDDRLTARALSAAGSVLSSLRRMVRRKQIDRTTD